MGKHYGWYLAGAVLLYVLYQSSVNSKASAGGTIAPFSFNFGN